MPAPQAGGDSEILHLLASADGIIFSLEDGLVRRRSRDQEDYAIADALKSLVPKWQIPVKLLSADSVHALAVLVNDLSEELLRDYLQIVDRFDAEHSPHWRPLPAARQLLQYLASQGTPVAIVSRQAQLNAEACMSSHFPSFAGRVVGRPTQIVNMFPRPHALMTAQMGIGAKNALVVTSDKDVAAAGRALRMRVVRRVPQRDPAVESVTAEESFTSKSVFVVGSLFELLDCVDPNRTASDEELKERRAEFLLGKGRLTSEEMREYNRLIGGEFTYFGNPLDWGVVDPTVAERNRMVLRVGRREAAKSSLLLEVLASSAALIEMHLRRWVANQSGRNFSPTERLTLGAVIGRAESANLDPGLILRLKTFLGMRNEAVHGIAMGRSDYFELGVRLMKDPSLIEDLDRWVTENNPASRKWVCRDGEWRQE